MENNKFNSIKRYSSSNAHTQRYSLLKQPLLNTLNSHLIDYPTPSNLNTSWNGGSLAGILLMAQIITGVCLAMHYTAHVDLAFSSVQHILCAVNKQNLSLGYSLMCCLNFVICLEFINYKR
jgi:quinol-cytochrome oxidoreductase complex cytochrome b subunit